MTAGYHWPRQLIRCIKWRLPINLETFVALCLDSVLFSATPFEPLHQSEAWCTTIHMKMSLICMWVKSHFHMKGWAPRLALRKRLKVIRKWRISSVCQTHYCLFTSFKSLVELSIFLRVFTVSGKETKSSQMAENLIHWLHYCHWSIFITPDSLCAGCRVNLALILDCTYYKWFHFIPLCSF